MRALWLGRSTGLEISLGRQSEAETGEGRTLLVLEEKHLEADAELLCRDHRRPEGVNLH